MSEITTTSPTAEQPSDFLSRSFLGLRILNWEQAIYLLFIILAIVTRFWALGNRVMSHDESLHTQFSYQYFDGQGYQHTPLMHGPFLFHITALSYWLLGASDFAARLPVAIFGVILVISPYFLRPWLGRAGALVTSFVFLISPYVTYYSRYIRHDVYVIIWSLIVFIAIWYYIRDRRDRYLWWFVAGTALMFSTKEVAFIYVAIFGSYLVIRLAVQIYSSGLLRASLDKLKMPALLALLGLLLVGGGFLGTRAGAGTETTAETSAATEGFAVDPNAETSAAIPAATDNSAAALRWLTLAGIGVTGVGLFLAARALRPGIDDSPDFDLIILFTTLLLPLASPFLTKLAGWNPTDYTLNHCVLEGQESLTALQLLAARVGNTSCWTTMAQSGITRSGLFLVIAMAVGVLIGLWWDRRRWIIAAVIFNAIILVLYTSFFTNLGGWTTGVVGSLGYWLEQQAVQRGSQPSYYYLFVVPLYEFLPLIFSLLAIWLWMKIQGTNRVIGYWIATLLLGLLAFSLVNWVYANATAVGGIVEQTTAVPGLLAGGGILLLAALFWFARYRPRLIAELELTGGLSQLFDLRSLLEFVPFVIWWLLLTWLAYSYAGEKMPWLSIHFVIPMGMLTGWYFNEKLAGVRLRELVSRPSLILGGLTALLIIAFMLVFAPLFLGRINLGDQQLASLTAVGRLLGTLVLFSLVYFIWRRAFRNTDASLRNRVLTLSIFGLLAILTIRFTYMSSFTNADYTNEFMVYAHGAPATKSVVLDQLEELSLRLHGDKSIKVAFDSDVSWPLTWYLRDYPNRVFFGTNPSQALNESPVVIVGAQNWDVVEPYLGNNYESTEHTFLWWPMEDYRRFSWNALLGDPQMPADQRRGLGNPAVREALWDIFFFRNYEKYGEVFGGTYTAGEWPLRHNLRMYVRKDVLASLWDYGVGAVAVAELADPYSEGALAAQPVLAINESGIAGSEEGQLSAPRNVTVGPDGRIYALDSGNNRVQVFNQDGLFLQAWGSSGTGAGQFNEPWGIAVDETNVFVTDTWNHRIQKFTLDGEYVASFGSSGSPNPDSGDEGLGLFFGPRSIMNLEDSRLLVTDTGNHRLQVLDKEGNFLFQVGGFGNGLGQMNEPVGLSQGPDGSVYLADTWNSRIQQFAPELFAVNAWPVNAWEGTSINNKPYTATDSSGRVYTTDPENYRVLIFEANGDYVGRLGEFGVEIDRFGLPNGIAIDTQDNVFVADAGNNRIVKYAPLLGPGVGPSTSDQEEAPPPPPDQIEESAVEEDMPLASPTPTGG